MATPKNTHISAAEIELKRRGRRRLIGAITLGLLAIVFLPMVFDSEPKRTGAPAKTQEIQVQIPPKEGLPPLPAPTAPPPTTTVAPEPAKAVEPAKAIETPVAAPPLAKTEVAKTPPSAKATPPAKMAEKAKALDKSGFVVQLGVFSTADNATHTVDKMKEAKLPVYTESIPIKSGNATRVRVGPFPTREKADAALAAIKLAGRDGKIVPVQGAGR